MITRLSFSFPLSFLLLVPAFLASESIYLPVQAEPSRVSIEWSAPSSQAEAVMDSLAFDGQIKSQANVTSDTKAFPIVIVLAGIVAFDKLSTTLYDVYRQSRPGTVVTKKPDGTIVVKQVKNLPLGCVIYSYGGKTTECIWTSKNEKDDPMKVLAALNNFK